MIFLLGRQSLALVLPALVLVAILLEGPICLAKPSLRISPDIQKFLIDYNEDGQGPKCETQGESPESFSPIRWSGPNSLDNHDYLIKRHQTIPKESNRSVRIRFIKPTAADSGIYYCQTKYQGNDVLIANITVEFFDPLRFTECPFRQALIKGSNSEKIRCRATGDKPEMNIYKDDIPQGDLNRYYWDNAASALEVTKPVSEIDSGTYRFEARSDKDGKVISREIQVEVHSEPVISRHSASDPDGSFHGVEDGPATLWCNVSGNPKPLVYWTNPRRDNLTRDTENYIEVPEEGKLIIRKVRASHDSGTFECSAVNNINRVSQAVPFSVLTRPRIQSFNNVTADENSEFTIECRSTGQPQPQMSIRRYGIGQKAYSYGDNHTRGIDFQLEGGGGIPVHVYRVKLNGSRSLIGEHFCNSTSKEAGSDEARNFVHINYPPDVSSTPVDQYVQLGKNFSLTCRVQAYPAPSIFWYDGNTQIINPSSKTLTSPDGQTHIITMMPNNLQQAVNSLYTCKATNRLGSAEIRIRPMYTTRPGPVSTEIIEQKPTSVKLKFHVINDGGDPIRYFRFVINGRSLDLNNPLFSRREDFRNDTLEPIPLPYTYTITNLLPRFNYQLKVRAANALGEGDEDQKSFTTGPPERPDPPTIKRPSSTSTIIPSHYRNGYQLEWAEPLYDNGDPINKYLVEFYLVRENSLGILIEDGPRRSTEIITGKPLTTKLGPLEANQRYKIEVRAVNALGTSNADYILITTSNNQPSMPEFEGQSLQWLVDPPTPFVVTLLIIAICLAIVVDLTFYFCCQMGALHSLCNEMCARKTTSVIDDKQAYHSEESA